MPKRFLIVFTDLDGTLLDYNTYSPKASANGIELLKRYDIPLIFCTSKSYAEVLYFRKQTNNLDPFIVENGGAIYIPVEQFKQFKPLKPYKQYKEFDGYVTIELGTDYKKIRQVFAEMKKESGDNIVGFGDMSVRDVSKYLNLGEYLAGMAKKRLYDEPFLVKKRGVIERITKIAHDNGLKVYAGTRFYHLMGNTDKGVGVSKLISIYKNTHNNLTTAGIGEGKNDEPMLANVMMPYAVKKPDNTFTHFKLAVQKINAIGPAGFSIAVKDLLNKS